MFLRHIAAMALWMPILAGTSLQDPVARASRYTYADLLGLICKDLTVDSKDPGTATASGRIKIRELGSETAPEAWDDDLSVGSVDTVDVLENAQILVSFTVTSETSIPDRALALFLLAPAAKLLDVVIVPGFPDDTSHYSSQLPLGAHRNAYLFESDHHNSAQGYHNTIILFVRENRIEQIAEVGLLSCNCYASGAEDEIQSFEETQKIATLPDPERDYRKIVIRVTLKGIADPPDSPRRPQRQAYVRFFIAEYRWDASAKRFVTASKRLEQLKAFNMKRL